jgi:hypothetical protein
MKNRNIIFATIVLTLGFLVLSRIAHGVLPAPDGGYPGFNTAEGQNALFGRTTGVWNTALGAFTLYADTTGTGNTAVGINGLRSNVTGGFNTAVGLNALFFNNGDPGAGAASDNDAFGAYALFHNTTGDHNCAFGVDTLFNNSTGHSNCAFGSDALNMNISGIFNTAIGAEALALNTASDNTGIGYAALVNNRDGVQNTATGALALVANSGGNFNTALGYQALDANDTASANTAVGVSALLRDNAGGANTALGYGAGANVTTGSFNVYIGANMGGVADEVGHTYISNIASTQQNLSVVTVDLATGLLGHEFSSRRYKDDIKPMDNASEALFALKPVTYRYKKEIDKNQAVDYGLIAEEVAKVDPNLAVRNGKGQIESVRYTAINAMLLNEFLKEHRKLQEQAREIQEQSATIRKLKKGMDTVVARLNEHESRIQKVSAQVETSRQGPQVAMNRP